MALSFLIKSTKRSWKGGSSIWKTSTSFNFSSFLSNTPQSTTPNSPDSGHAEPANFEMKWLRSWLYNVYWWMVKTPNMPTLSSLSNTLKQIRSVSQCKVCPTSFLKLLTLLEDSWGVIRKQKSDKIKGRILLLLSVSTSKFSSTWRNKAQTWSKVFMNSWRLLMMTKMILMSKEMMKMNLTQEIGKHLLGWANIITEYSSFWEDLSNVCKIIRNTMKSR